MAADLLRPLEEEARERMLDAGKASPISDDLARRSDAEFDRGFTQGGLTCSRMPSAESAQRAPTRSSGSPTPNHRLPGLLVVRV